MYKKRFCMLSPNVECVEPIAQAPDIIGWVAIGTRVGMQRRTSIRLSIRFTKSIPPYGFWERSSVANSW
jgi:hypothetical protein